jgi:hypothetical protein
MEDNALDNLPVEGEVTDTPEVEVAGRSMRDFAPSEDTPEPVEKLEDDVGQEDAVEQSDNQLESEEPAEPQEESFAQGFDPNSLPDELKVAYKQMQADYTRKTTEIAQARKEVQQYKPVIDYIAANPTLVQRLIAETQSPQQQVADKPQEAEPYPDDIEAFAKRVREEAKKEALEEFNKFYSEDRQRQLAEQQQREAQQRYERDVAEASKIDPRFDTDEVFSEEVAIRVASDMDYRSGSKTLIQATKDAIARYDGFITSRLDQEKKKFSELAKTKRKPQPTASSGKTVVSEKKSIGSMRDAVPDEFLD